VYDVALGRLWSDGGVTSGELARLCRADWRHATAVLTASKLARAVAGGSEDAEWEWVGVGDGDAVVSTEGASEEGVRDARRVMQRLHELTAAARAGGGAR
jgi:hypothetical protein